MRNTEKRTVWICLIACLFALVCHTTVFAEPKAFEYLIPEADTRVYTSDEVGVMPLQVTCYAKNEIYARHGRKFNSRELTEYFNEQPWYQGTIEPGDFSDSLLNRTEQENIQTLAQRERALSWDGNGYEVDAPDYDFSAIYEYLSRDSYNILDGIEVYAVSATAFLETEHFYIMLPVTPKWSYFQIDKDAFEIYYPPAKEAGYGGHIVSIAAYDWTDNSYTEFPSWRVCGLSNDKKYVAIFPTDVQFDPADRTQSEEYGVLLRWAETLDYEAEDGSNPFTTQDP